MGEIKAPQFRVGDRVSYSGPEVSSPTECVVMQRVFHNGTKQWIYWADEIAGYMQEANMGLISASPCVLVTPKDQTVDAIRQFDTGATRGQDTDKLDIEGFESPLVLHRFAQYMHLHRKLGDGNMRASDNWQKGMSRDVYLKSLLRHVLDIWLLHRGFRAREDIESALCALRFNCNGYLFEILKDQQKEQHHV